MSAMSNVAAMSQRERFALGASNGYAYGCARGPLAARLAMHREAVPMGTAYTAGWASELARAALRRRFARR